MSMLICVCSTPEDLGGYNIANEVVFKHADGGEQISFL